MFGFLQKYSTTLESIIFRNILKIHEEVLCKLFYFIRDPSGLKSALNIAVYPIKPIVKLEKLLVTIEVKFKV